MDIELDIIKQYNCSQIQSSIMLVNTIKHLLKSAHRVPIICTPSFRVASSKLLNTQVFSDLPYSKLADPQFVKALIIKPIHNHSRMSQRYLYHRKRVSGKIVSCFSEKKHKVFRRVRKIRREFRSQILGQNIPIVVSSKAMKTITKMGSFDNYILCTKPIDLDSKYGEYLRELMLRKINDSSFRIPYVIGTNRKLRVKSYRKKQYIESLKKVIIPKEVKQSLRTFQRKFGKTPDELNNQDYAKFVQLQSLKKTLGDQLEATHPLLLELKQKMKPNLMTDEEEKRLNQMSKQAEQKFVNHPKRGEANRKRVEKAKHDIQILNLKIEEMRYKLDQQYFNLEEK